MLERFRSVFWLPPRPHGEVIGDRTVSFLELFYDLVYVVVVARAAGTLAEHVSWRTLADFVVVFGLIWIAWLNGTLYYDLHGREDGRTRVFVFAQMLIIALLAVFASEAAGADGAAFAVVYALFLAVLAWLWYVVRRQDAEQYKKMTGRYLSGMLVSIVIIATSAGLPDDLRLVVWAIYVVGWVTGTIMLTRTFLGREEIDLSATDSTVERFGLFTIIVLGEVVVGVVGGLSESERTVEPIATGLLGLTIGLAIWWTYFDFAGRRMPNITGGSTVQWMLSHLPFTLAVASSGAAMVSLIEHATDPRAPSATSWLLASSVAVALIALIITLHSLADYERFPSLYRPLSFGLGTGAAVAMLIGWWRPAPWLLALSLFATLTVVWIYAVYQWLQLDDPSQVLPGVAATRS